MDGKYPIDTGMRILGGVVLIILGINVLQLTTISRAIAIIVGIYAFITGIINFCPLLMGVAKEKEIKRKKTFKNQPVKPTDLKGLRFFLDLTEEEIERIVIQQMHLASCKKLHPGCKNRLGATELTSTGPLNAREENWFVGLATFELCGRPETTDLKKRPQQEGMAPCEPP